MKNSHRPLFLLHQTLQLALCIGAGRVLLASTKPRVVCGITSWWSVIHHSRERVSTAPTAVSFILLQPTLGIAHGDLRLVRGCSALETHFMKLLMNSYSADVASRVSLEISTRWSRSVSLCGLPLCGWAVVAPRCFHFTITALTVERGSSSRVEIWRTDLLERWYPMTVPSWKSLSSSVRPFYWKSVAWNT